MKISVVNEKEPFGFDVKVLGNSDYGTLNDNVPYLFRSVPSGLGILPKAYDEIVGGTVAWNQLLDASNISQTYQIPFKNGCVLTQGHKMLFYFDHTIINQTATPTAVWLYVNQNGDRLVEKRIILSPATSYIYNCEVNAVADGWIGGQSGQNSCWVYTANPSNSNRKTIMCIDLTLLFGSAIADYIYTLETTHTGDGVAFFRSLFPKPYYAYDAGSLQSVNTSEHKMVGKNRFDKDAVTMNKWIDVNATTISTSNGYAVTDYIPVIQGEVYYMGAKGSARTAYYDTSKNGIEYIAYSGGSAFTARHTGYMRFTLYANNMTALVSSLQFEKSNTPTTYEPYTSHSYPLDSSLTLRGIPKLDSNNKLYYDGDTYEADGTVTRKYGIVDLGTLTWDYRSDLATGMFASSGISNYKKDDFTKAICGRYKYGGVVGSGVSAVRVGDKTCSLLRNNTTQNMLYVYDTAYNDAATFKSAMSGVYFVYELSTPTTETATGFTEPQIVDNWGTEEYIDYSVSQSTRDVGIPVGHNTTYKYIEALGT